MKTTLFAISFILLYNLAFAQPNDAINGKLKSVKEQLFFLDENHQNLKLFSTEGDYGHNGFLSEEYTTSRFHTWWYETFWVHYINYYKEFDVDGKLLKVAWYAKNQSEFNASENTYDLKGNLTNQKIENYGRSTVMNKYDKNNNLIFSKAIDSNKKYSTTKRTYNSKNKISSEVYYDSKSPKYFRETKYFYDSNLNLVKLQKFDEDGEQDGMKYQYNEKNKRIKIIYHSPYIWVKTKEGSSQERSKNGADRLEKEIFYNKNSTIAEIKSFTPADDDENEAQISGREVRSYYDKKVNSIYYYDEKDSVKSFKKFEYDDRNRKISESHFFPNFPKNDITAIFTYDERDYPIKLIYTEDNITKEVDFDYTFDAKNNWIEQTKSVDGKKLYVWKRELKYFE